MPEALGRRIAGLRTERGWTQQDLAGRIAVSRVALSHLEAGMRTPGERTVALLAAVFGCEPHDLVDGTDYPDAKAERLPLTVPRYTEVEHRLALLDADLAWLAGEPDAVAASRVRARWAPELDRLARLAVDEHERARIDTARRRLAAT